MIIFNEARPKYEKLDELLSQQLIDIKFSNQVNIIIDLKEIIRKFFRPDIGINETKSSLEIEEISSDILGIIAHYRNYFYKKGKYTSFYFMYSYKKCDEFIKDYPDYKKEYYEKYIFGDYPKCDIAKRAIEVIEKVSKCFPHVEFIETSKFDEYIYTKFLQTILNKNEITLILSNDQIFYQLINDNTFILNIKGIKSQLVTPENCLQVLSKKDNIGISSKLLPLILAIGGCKKASIAGLPNVATIKAINIISKLCKDNKIIDSNLIELPIKFSELNPKVNSEKNLIDNKDLITSNYKFIRGDEIMYKNILSLKNDFLFGKKIIAKSYFLELNSKIFAAYPLHLEMMLKGEEIK